MLKIYIPKNIIIHKKKRNYDELPYRADEMIQKKSKKFDELETLLVKGCRGCWMEMERYLTKERAEIL